MKIRLSIQVEEREIYKQVRAEGRTEALDGN